MPEVTRDAVALPGGWPLQLGPFAALAGAALYLRSRWASLPERFPIHWRLDGRPNGWANRNAAGVYGPLLIAAVVAGSMALFAVLLRRRSGQIQAGEPAEAERRFRRATLWTLVGTEYFIALVFTWVGLLPLSAAASGGPPGPPPLVPFFVLTLTFVTVVTIGMVRAAQARGRAAHGARHAGHGEAPFGDRSPDRCWKAGIFYVNPDDPALFVEKRFGIGYTLNFAHPLSWLILGLSILAPLAVTLWVVHAAS